MTIELLDMDVPYSLSIDINDDGNEFVRVMANSAIENRVSDYDICLDKDQCKELARVLLFMAKEIK